MTRIKILDTLGVVFKYDKCFWHNNPPPKPSAMGGEILVIASGFDFLESKPCGNLFISFCQMRVF